jgi:hypothetical protein
MATRRPWLRMSAGASARCDVRGCHAPAPQEAHTETRQGLPYWVYEHVSQVRDSPRSYRPYGHTSQQLASPLQQPGPPAPPPMLASARLTCVVPSRLPPQGSPTITSRTKESFRHALAVTTYRPGQDGSPYLYTLNLS